METVKTENIMGTMPEGRLLFKLAMPMIFSVGEIPAKEVKYKI